MHDDVLVDRIRRTYTRKLTKLYLNGTGKAGTTAEIMRRGGWHNAPQMTARSLLDSRISVTLMVTNIVIGHTSGLAGSYPPRSRLIISSVDTRWARSGTPAELDLTETDSWGTVLVPASYETYSLSMGRVATSKSYTRHYRHILGPDLKICTIDPYDAAIMRTNQVYE